MLDNTEKSSGVRWNVALDDVHDLAGEVEADEHPVAGQHLPQAVGQPLVLLRHLGPHPEVLSPHIVTQERDTLEGHLPPQYRLCRVGVPHSPAARPAMHRQSVTSE